MSLKDKLKKDPRVKAFVLYALMPKGQARPRTWVKWFVNPFFHKKAGGTGAPPYADGRAAFNPFHIGAGSTIEDFATVNNGVGGVVIGDGVRIGIGNVLIGPVRIGNNVIIAQNVVMSGLNHGYEDISVPVSLQPVSTAEIVVEDDCWIGANAVLTAGVTIGRHSVVAGGSVVTKDVPPFCVVGGNPARILKRYNESTGAWEKA